MAQNMLAFASIKQKIYYGMNSTGELTSGIAILLTFGSVTILRVPAVIT